MIIREDRQLRSGKRKNGIIHTSEKEALRELKEKSMSSNYKNVIMISGKKLKK